MALSTWPACNACWARVISGGVGGAWAIVVAVSVVERSDTTPNPNCANDLNMGPLRGQPGGVPKLGATVRAWLSPGCLFVAATALWAQATATKRLFSYQLDSIEGDTPNACRNAVVKCEWL